MTELQEKRRVIEILGYVASSSIKYSGLMYGVANAVGEEANFDKVVAGGIAYLVGSLIEKGLQTKQMHWYGGI